MPRTMAACAALLWTLLAAGCDDSDPNAVISQGATPTRGMPGAMPSQPTPPQVLPQAPEPDERVYRDGDFVESEQNRDPFRSFMNELRAKAPVVAQRMVLMPDTAVEEMRLIAIISGIEQPRAMIVDPKGVGYVATRGDFLGKADVVQGGGSESLPVALNWRVDRIRANEVVLAREDPSAPGRAPLTKVIPLHADEPDLSGMQVGKDNG